MKIDITSITQTLYFYYEHLLKVTKKPDKWKKHSVLIIVQATFFGRNLSTSDSSLSPSYLSRKKGTSETFLSLSLFISRPRPTASASKIRLRLRKTFPRFPFFYFGNLGKTKIRRGQIFPQSSQHNYQNKILFLKVVMCGKKALRGQLHGGIFMFWYTSLAMAILLHKTAYCSNLWS